MKLQHEFSVPTDANRAFEALTDVRLLAGCLPGAVVDAVRPDGFDGGVKVKVGPIGMSFSGSGRFVEQDRDSGRIVLSAAGRDRSGGGAQADIHMALHPEGGSTRVTVDTDLDVSGRAAQFGGGVIRDVSNNILRQFTTNLAGRLAGSAPGPVAATGSAAETQAVPTTPTLDLGSLVMAMPATRSVGIPVAAAVGGLLFGYLMGRCAGRSA